MATLRKKRCNNRDHEHPFFKLAEPLITLKPLIKAAREMAKK